MELTKGFIGEEFPTIVQIEENGVKYEVDIKDGQKTGFFLDQKYNRLAIQRLCKNAKVLDCFTHTGSFALNAGIAGAQSVLGVDASETAVNQARRNAAIALLFAIQNLKPSPFCLLDEIEAALDDSNVGRFAGYLQKLTKNTQFIIITHRRGTMNAADRLYGITMQEKGVSTLVSVDLVENQLTR